MRTTPSSPSACTGCSTRPGPSLPQAARVLDAGPELWPDEVRIDVETLNLDAASFRQLAEKHRGDGDAVRAEVLDIVAERGKMQNPVTGSGGMLIGTVAEVGPDSPLGLAVGDRVATLVSLSLTPLTVTDGLARWDGRSERVPAQGTAVLFGRSIAAAAARRPVARPRPHGHGRLRRPGPRDPGGGGVRRHAAVRPRSACSVAAGKSGSLSLAAAAAAGAGARIGVVPHEARGRAAARAAASPMRSSSPTPAHRSGSRMPWPRRAGRPTSPSCASTSPGCEQPAILATAQGGTIIYFSMATSFSAAALGAEGLAADVRMLVGNGYVPGHADLALDLVRSTPAVRALFEGRLEE